MKERFDNGSQIVDFDNIGYLKVKSVKGVYKVFFTYKPKLKLEEIELLKPFNNLMDIKNFFADRNFYMLEDYLINVNNIQMMRLVKGEDSPSSLIEIIFSNFPAVVIKTSKTRWDSFKNLKLT